MALPSLNCWHGPTGFFSRSVSLDHQRPYISKTSKCIVARRPALISVDALSTVLHAAEPGDAEAPVAQSAQVSVPTEFWCPDRLQGTRLVVHQQVHNAATPTRAVSTHPLVNRIGCVTPLSMQQAAEEEEGSERLLVADVKGNLFVLDTRPLLELGQHVADEEADVALKSKRARTEASTSNVADDVGGRWQPIVTQHDIAPQRGALPPFGASGWCGLLSSRQHVVVARESYKDIRVVDTEAGRVVSTLYPTHAPTSICWSSFRGCGSLITVADGPHISIFDVRTNSNTTAHRVSTHSPLCWSVVCLGEEHPFSVASADGNRCVNIWDTRKWNVVHSVQNTLKYDVVALAPVGGGSHLVCTGVDAEMRVVSTVKPPKQAAAAAGDAPDDADADVPHVSSFRTRIDSTAHCSSSWFGSWCETAVPKPTNAANAYCPAVGISTTNEVYLAVV